MGLGIGGASWSYSGFNEFRDRLAEAAGIDLYSMNGFGGAKSWRGLTDPIVPLLMHSDCEGALSPAECVLVAPRLRELVADWKGWPEEYDREQALLLADSMDQCADTWEPLGFH